MARMSRKGKAAQRDVLRARIVLLTAAGGSDLAVAAQLRINRHTVRVWRQQFAAPRSRDLADKRLYVPGKASQWPALSSLIGASIRNALIEQQFSEVVRLVASIQQGTVTASLILRKLGAYPRQNGLAVALRELGRIERTLFMLTWLQDPALRRRSPRVGTRAKLVTHSRGRSFSIGLEKYETVPLRTSIIVPAA